MFSRSKNLGEENSYVAMFEEPTKTFHSIHPSITSLKKIMLINYYIIITTLIFKKLININVKEKKKRCRYCLVYVLYIV